MVYLSPETLRILKEPQILARIPSTVQPTGTFSLNSKGQISRPPSRVTGDFLSAAPRHFTRFAWLIFHDVPSHCARRHRQRTRKVHLTRPAATGEIPILRA